MKIETHTQRGLSLVEVFLVLATIALLAVFFLPTLSRPQRRSKGISCVNQLKFVGLAYRLWSGDHDDRFPFSVSAVSGGTREFTNSPQAYRHFQALSNELNTPKLLVCPMDSNKHRATDFMGNFNSNSNVSYFVALDADESKPERLLSGDRNVAGTMTNGFLRLLQPVTKAGWTAEMHNNKGNIGLADGSVVQTDPIALRRLLRTNPLPFIRLAIP